MPDLEEFLAAQDGVVSRGQALAHGLTAGTVSWQVTSRRWRTLHPGVYVTHTGPLSWSTRVWAALLHAGPGAVASHRTAAFVQGLLDQAPGVVEVTVPHAHRVTDAHGVRVHRSRHLGDRRHPAASLPQTRVEDTVLDLVDACTDAGEVVTLVLRACQRRLTTTDRLAAAAARRRRLRHRSLVRELLEDASAGIESALERRWHRDVERAHRLPRGTRQGTTRVGRRRWYWDLRFDRYRVRVQLEGVAWHPDDLSWRDDARDNAAVVVDDDVVLRYGCGPVTVAPCQTALETATVLRRRGWAGSPHPCSPGCVVAARDTG